MAVDSPVAAGQAAEPIDVVAAFAGGGLKPTLLVWRRRRYRVMDVDQSWSRPDGSQGVWHFRLRVEEELSPWSEKTAFRPPNSGRGRPGSGGGDGRDGLFEVAFDPRNLTWLMVGR